MKSQPPSTLPAVIDTSTMVIRTQRSTWRYVLDLGLTIAAWWLFVYLWNHGVRTMWLQPEVDGLTLPIVQQLWPTLLDLGAYALAIGLQGLLLIGWVFYNTARFRGKQRRAPAGPLDDYQLLADYHISADSLSTLRKSTVCSIQHAIDGRIVHITPHSPSAPLQQPSPLPTHERI